MYINIKKIILLICFILIVFISFKSFAYNHSLINSRLKKDEGIIFYYEDNKEVDVDILLKDLDKKILRFKEFYLLEKT